MRTGVGQPGNQSSYKEGSQQNREVASVMPSVGQPQNQSSYKEGPQQCPHHRDDVKNDSYITKGLGRHVETFLLFGDGLRTVTHNT